MKSYRFYRAQCSCGYESEWFHCRWFTQLIALWHAMTRRHEFENIKFVSCDVGKIEAQVKEMMEKKLITKKTHEEPHFFWHWQNLGKGRRSKDTKGLWRDGRAWWHFGNFGDRSIGLEWHFFGATSTGADFHFAGEEFDFKFHASIKGLFAIWLTISHLPIFHKAFHDISESWGYQTGFSFHNSTLYVHFAHSDMWGSRTVDFKFLPNWVHVWEGMTYKNYNWWHGFYVSIDFADALLGREKHSCEDVGAPDLVNFFLFPDLDLGKTYMIKVQMQRHFWKRPRWFRYEQMRAYYECEPPIPMPGKGESDWDTDDDAIHSGYMKAASPEAAVRQLLYRVKKTRDKYGLPNSIQELLPVCSYCKERHDMRLACPAYLWATSGKIEENKERVL